MSQDKHSLALTEAVYYILLSLQEPRHGYGIKLFVNKLSNNRVNLATGTIYGALNNLVAKGLIEVDVLNGRKKEYIITDLGHDVLQSELYRLMELVQNGHEFFKSR